VKKAIHQIEEAAKREDNLSGVPSGYTKLDRLTSGWQRSDLIIVAARPSMGKTAFALSMARNIAVEHKRPIAIFSLEMSSIQLVNRLIVSETELPSDRIRNGRLEEYEWKQLDYKIKSLVEAPIFIDDTPAISIFELRAKCRRLKVQHDIEVIIVDYLQLMSGTGDIKGSREQEVSTISRSLKAIAKELDVPVIALSQLNRSVELRSGNKRPQLSDLRESGAIEQDADIVIFIHRPEKYDIYEDEQGRSLIGVADIILAKHRNGPIGDIQLKFKDESAKFVELDALPPLAGEESNGSFTVGSKMNQEGVEDDTELPY
jgi:replicative DNA helicase